MKKNVLPYLHTAEKADVFSRSYFGVRCGWPGYVMASLPYMRAGTAVHGIGLGRNGTSEHMHQ